MLTSCDPVSVINIECENSIAEVSNLLHQMWNTEGDMSTKWQTIDTFNFSPKVNTFVGYELWIAKLNTEGEST